jgi:hypothetical protein
MQFSEKQLKFIKNKQRDIAIFLSGNPRRGDINAELQKQWLELLMDIHNAGV